MRWLQPTMEEHDLGRALEESAELARALKESEALAALEAAAAEQYRMVIEESRRQELERQKLTVAKSSTGPVDADLRKAIAASLAAAREDAELRMVLEASARANAGPVTAPVPSQVGVYRGADGRVRNLAPALAPVPAFAPVLAPVPAFAPAHSRVNGSRVPISGAGNNCLPRSIADCLKDAKPAGMPSTPEAFRAWLSHIIAANRDNVGAWVSVDEMLGDLAEGRQLNGEPIFRILAETWRRTFVVLKIGTDGVATCRVYGAEYNNWTGVAIVHSGDTGAYEGGHYDLLDTRNCSNTSIAIRGDRLPARP